ncbi:uncharacterized protein J3R85_009954 [Psidium guajava]|nr:uncharacterized protein J3R85_009954 [Psidium guajava]
MRNRGGFGSQKERQEEVSNCSFRSFEDSVSERCAGARGESG